MHLREASPAKLIHANTHTHISTSLLTRVEVLNPLAIKMTIDMYRRKGFNRPPSYATPVGSSS